MDNKKEKIIHAAIDVFQEKGIEKTKVSDIVKGAGIAQGTFYLYFSSKLSVMPAIAQVMVEKMMEEMKEHVNEKRPFDKQLEQVVDVVFDITNSYRSIFAMVYAGLASSEYLQQWEKIYQPYYEWMGTFFKQPKAKEVLREDLSIEPSVKLVIGLIESAAEQVYLYDQLSKEEAVTKKQEVLEFMRHALYKKT
ncbi:TetR family transcriptional regulator [Oceanobacillus polygoni]|uniref:AcrR family transcriptional regulator n=1 Tax=Oceanobacillus polygoni TaxID=1235259 RepID=A0A9X1CC80_9BACI|nr:TetR family transcriptional regulator [Oceanobacillus polygoni]MBP2078489.1 AcrR family transcriptional regulator [Oceanobacillus polygoni]